MDSCSRAGSRRRPHSANLAWFAWISGPIEDKLLPTLQDMIARSRGFTGQIAEIDRDGDNIVTLAEYQHDAQVPIVADSPEALPRARRGGSAASGSSR